MEKHRRRSHRRGRLTTPRGVTERERRQAPGRRRREAPRHRSERALGLPLECPELPLLGYGTYSGPAGNSKREWPGLAFEPLGGYKTATVTRKVQSYLVWKWDWHPPNLECYLALRGMEDRQKGGTDNEIDPNHNYYTKLETNIFFTINHILMVIYI